MAMCGPSAEEKAAQVGQMSLANSMFSNYTERFGEQSQVLKNLNDSLTPILEAGPSQQGFSAEELAARNTAAINNAGAANRNTRQAVGSQLAYRGGDSGLESGIDRAIKAGISSDSASGLASEQNKIVGENYATGRDNYKMALSGENALAGQYNPSSFGSQAGEGFKNSFSEADRLNTQSQAFGKDLLSGSVALAKSFAGGLGNLDMVPGSSTAGEQALNFFGGMGK